MQLSLAALWHLRSKLQRSCECNKYLLCSPHIWQKLHSHPTPSTPHQDLKCKPAGPPWGGRAGATTYACTHTGDRRQGGQSSAVHTQFLKKRWFLSREWNPSPSASLCCFVFPSYTKAAFHSLLFPVLLQNVHPYCLCSSAQAPGIPA